MECLSTNLIADYTELANDILDNIPMLKLEDYKTVKTALKNLINNTQIQEALPEHIATKVTSLKEMIEDPSIFAEERFHSDFRAIIIARMKEKREYLKILSPTEKENQIADFKRIQEKTAQNQEKMAKSTPPVKGTEGHTIDVPPEIIEQVREILADLGDKLTQIKVLLKIMGKEIVLISMICHKNSYIDIKEEAVKNFLNKNFDIPKFHPEDDDYKIKEILCNYLDKYAKALSTFGLNLEFSIDCKFSYSHLITQFKNNLEKIRLILENIDLKLTTKCDFKNDSSWVSPYYVEEFLKYYPIPEFPQDSSIEDIKNSFRAYIKDCKEPFKTHGIDCDFYFSISKIKTPNETNKLENEIKFLIYDFIEDLKSLEDKINKIGFNIEIKGSHYNKKDFPISKGLIQKFKESKPVIPKFPEAKEFWEIKGLVLSYLKNYKESLEILGIEANFEITFCESDPSDDPEVNLILQDFIQNFYHRLFLVEKSLIQKGFLVYFMPDFYPENREKQATAEELQKLKEIDFTLPEFPQTSDFLEIIPLLEQYRDNYIKAFHQIGYFAKIPFGYEKVPNEFQSLVAEIILSFQNNLEKLNEKANSVGFPIYITHQIRPDKELSHDALKVLANQIKKLNPQNLLQNTNFDETQRIVHEYLIFCREYFDSAGLKLITEIRDKT